MRRQYLLTGFGAAVDGLIGAVFGVEAFAAATAVLGLACAWSYRQDIRAGWLALRSANQATPVLSQWQEFDLLPLKFAACMWHGFPPTKLSLSRPIVQEEIARLSLAVQQRKLEHRVGDTYHAALLFFSVNPADDQFSKEALVRYAKEAGRDIPAFLRSVDLDESANPPVEPVQVPLSGASAEQTGQK